MKKSFKKALCGVLAGLMVAAAVPAAVPQTAYVAEVQAATKLKLNKSKVTLNVGKSYKLKVSGTKKTPKWKSGNTKVATVNKSGKVTAKKAGKAKIQAIVGGKKLVCTVTVKKASAASSKLAANYTKVINYIKKNGKYSEDGTKYIDVAIDSGTRALLSYDPKSNNLDMGLTLRVEKENIVSTIDVIANCTKSNNAKVYSSIFTSGIELYTKATMKASSYTAKTNLTFYNASGSKAQSDIQEAANATLQAAVAGTEYLLTSKLHMSLKDLGFTAYKL